MVRSRTALRAEVPVQGGALLSDRHLVVPGDDGRQAPMGAVHLVQLGANPHDKHFLYDIEGDVNEGQKRLVAKGRRGPFAAQTGRSTVMDRSRHVSYRSRYGAMEITVSRGVHSTEVDALISKLAQHRASVPTSMVTIIKGRKKYRLGSLDKLDFQKLRHLIEDCLSQYGKCGLHVHDAKPGRGAMHKPGVHGPRSKNAARRKTGPFA